MPLVDSMILALILILAGVLLALGSGLTAVLRHPREDDPKRNRRRYVVPAAVGVVLFVVGSLALIISLVVAAVTT